MLALQSSENFNGTPLIMLGISCCCKFLHVWKTAKPDTDHNCVMGDKIVQEVEAQDCVLHNAESLILSMQ